MADQTVSVIFKAQDLMSGVVNRAQGSLDHFKASANNLASSKGGSTILNGIGLGAGISLWGGIERVIGDVTGAAGEAITKAEDLAVSQSKLTTALKDNVPAWTGNRDAIDTFLESGTNLGFTTNEMTNSFAGLVTATHDVSKAQVDMAAAQDLARFKGISLQEASDALVKVEGGRFRLLASLGIVLAKGATQEQALAAVQKVTAGQAEAYSKTTAGAFARLNATWDAAQEKLGAVLLPILTDVANFLADNLPAAIDDLGKGWQVLSNAAGRLADDIRLVLSPLGNLNDALGGVGDAIGRIPGPWHNSMQSMTDDAKNFGIAVQKGMVEGVAAIPDDLREHERVISDAGKALAGSLRDGLASGNQALAAEAQAAINTYGDTMSGPEARSHIKGAAAVIRTSVKSGWVPINHDALVAGAATSKGFADGLRQTRSAIDDAMNQIIEDLKHPLNRGKEIAHDLGLLTSKALAQGMRSGDPLIKAEANAERDAILARLTELKNQTGPIGKEGMAALGRGMHSKDPYIRQVASGIWNTAHKQLTKKVDGSSIGSYWVNSIAAGINNSKVALDRAIANVDGSLSGKSPPKEGPLKDLTGAPIGEWWVADIAKGIASSMGALHGALAGVMPSLALPGVAGGRAGGDSVGLAGRVPLTINFNSTWPPTREQAREIARIVDRELAYSLSG